MEKNMYDEKQVEIVKINELDLDMIAPSNKNMGDPSKGGSKIIVSGKPGCFTAGTPVLMYNGDVKKVEDVMEGDLVMGPDSQPRKVLELCRNNDEMFKVVPERGDSYTVNLEHKLVLKSGNTTIEISVKEFLTGPDSGREKWFVFRTGVDFPRKDVTVDPYTFGFTLDSDSIPQEYKCNDRKTRLELLAGILDSGKSITPDVVFLARSLGFSTTGLSIQGDINEIPVRTELGEIRLGNFENPLEASFKLEPQGYGDYYGFTIDGDHRFLLGSFDVVRNTGKTTLIASLLYAKRHIAPVGMVMSGTEDSNGFYKKIFPSTFVFNCYEEEQIQKLLKRQKIAKQHVENPWAILLLDDCTDTPAVFRRPLQQWLFKNGRHSALALYIISLQYALDILPVIRTNVDGIFILREPNLRNRKVLYENYASIIPDFKLFCDLMDQLTTDYSSLYIHNATRSNDWKECVFWYKAPIIPEDFRFGSKDFWDFHYDRYNPEYTDPL